jgi:hypothetical protein
VLPDSSGQACTGEQHGAGLIPYFSLGLLVVLHGAVLVVVMPSIVGAPQHPFLQVLPCPLVVAAAAGGEAVTSPMPYLLLDL